MSYLGLISALMAGGMAFLATKKPAWAVAVVVLSLPVYLFRVKFGWLPLTALELLLLGLFVGWAWRVLKEKSWRRINLGPYFWPGLGLVLAAGVSCFWSADKMAAAGIFKAYFLEPWLFYLVFINVIKTAREKKLLYGALALSAGVVAAVAIVQKFTGWWIPNDFWAAATTRRVTSVFGYPNAVGLYLGPIIGLLLGALIFRGVKTKPYWPAVAGGAVIGLSLSAIWCARSEGAVVALAVTLGLGGLISLLYRIFSHSAPGNKRRNQILSLLILLILSLGVALWAPLRTKLIEKITLQDLSGQIRLAMWQNTWEMLTDGRWLTGAGLASYQIVIAPYHQGGIFFNRDQDPEFHRHTVFNAEYRAAHWQPYEIYLYPHNLGLNFWSETGLPGLLVFVWLVVIFFRQGMIALKNGRGREFLPLFLAMAIILIHGLVDVPYFKNDLSVLFWLVLGLSAVIEKK